MSVHGIRPVTVTRGFTKTTPGSVLYQCGETVVLCTASLEQKVPDWMVGKGKGWITAEYNDVEGWTRQKHAEFEFRDPVLATFYQLKWS